MYAFEQAIIELFNNSNISFDFEQKGHLLSSPVLNIKFIPNVSEKIVDCQEILDTPHLHLWEDIYMSNSRLVISRISSLLGLNKRIHGRETIVTHISQKEFDDFLVENHLNGSTRSKFRYGLYHHQGLVGVAGFGRSCPIDYLGKTYRSHELIRFCNKRDVTVVGGLSKLLTTFTKQQKPQHIMTYIDKEWSNGENFLKLGFRLVAQTEPETFFIAKDLKRYRQHEVINNPVDMKHWQKITNQGNYKFIKILE